MWHNLADLSLPAWNLALRASVVYLSVLVLLRISGKRQLGQMAATEFVAILLISNAVQNAMNGGDSSLVGGVLLAAVLIFLSWLISLLTFKSRRFREVFEGTPILLVHKGKIIEKNLAHERITHSELRVLLRRQGIHDLHEIDSAILEAEGTLSVTKVSDL